ncbi:outer membrane beta-barrel protein [Hufsiella ginkgonis]|uniref:Outer membrane beta-barrel protein n=1 Tax=Hufsiella ginkgonis TaxID=2695274 RepID=A0A7K1Y2G1_9SPHI|nr:outer membrane beta-barrel protein [Hufsiella ginkgonis]MXV17189.1 outer membrane beta-barrel protein [Hufsiella ginkgonis]
MKRLVLTIVLAATAAMGYAARHISVDSPVDTIKTKKKTVTVTVGATENGIGIESKRDSLKNRSKAPGASFALTFERFDIGFSKLVDNGSFTLSPANQFLDYKSSKTSNVGFDILQFGYRFTSYFKIYVAGGFDWTHIRLEKDITILRDQPVLNYSVDAVEYEKNRFSSTYLRIPLGFDYRSKSDRRGKRFHLVAGPEVGFLLGGKVKQVSDENGKQKFKDDYHFSEFRYGAYARVGYGGAGLFYKQYFNDMFENSPAQKGLKNMAFGVMFGF